MSPPSEGGITWTDRQIKMMISMWKEPNIRDAIHQPKPVYALIAKRLNDVWGKICLNLLAQTSVCVDSKTSQ